MEARDRTYEGLQSDKRILQTCRFACQFLRLIPPNKIFSRRGQTGRWQGAGASASNAPRREAGPVGVVVIAVGLEIGGNAIDEEGQVAAQDDVRREAGHGIGLDMLNQVAAKGLKGEF